MFLALLTNPASKDTHKDAYKGATTTHSAVGFDMTMGEGGHSKESLFGSRRSWSFTHVRLKQSKEVGEKMKRGNDTGQGVSRFCFKMLVRGFSPFHYHLFAITYTSKAYTHRIQKNIRHNTSLYPHRKLAHACNHLNAPRPSTTHLYLVLPHWPSALGNPAQFAHHERRSLLPAPPLVLLFFRRKCPPPSPARIQGPLLL